jgi:hypothetical protein
MKRNKVIVALTTILSITAVFIWLSRSKRTDNTVRLLFVGYTNMGGNSMALFQVQNKQPRRIWIRGVEYLVGEAFREPAGAWQCSVEQGMSTRPQNSSSITTIPPQYIPPEPKRTSPEPSTLMVPVPPNQFLWRVGLVVEFELTPLQRMRLRLKSAWAERRLSPLTFDIFMNNSAEAIWTESPVITNLVTHSDNVANAIHETRP